MGPPQLPDSPSSQSGGSVSAHTCSTAPRPRHGAAAGGRWSRPRSLQLPGRLHTPRSPHAARNRWGKVTGPGRVAQRAAHPVSADHITSASPLASSLHLIITHEPPIEANYHAHGSPIGFSPVTEAPLTSRPASSLEHASGTLCTRHQSIRPANSPSTPCPPCRTVRRKAGCNYLKHPLLSVEGNSLR